MSDRYVLHHEGTWYYFLPDSLRSWGRGVPHADGEPMTASEGRGWYAAPREAAAVTIVTPGVPEVTGYRLTDPDTASVRYPMTLTPAEFGRLRDAAPEDQLSALYDQVTRETAEVITEVPGPWLRLDGEPPPGDGHAWTAALPAELRERGEYRHLFPGYLGGFRKHMEELFERQPSVKYVLDAKHPGSTQVYGLSVTLEVPFDQPRTEYVPARNLDGRVSRSRKGRDVQATATRRLELHVPYRIDGRNRAEAVAEWERAEAGLLAVVAAASVAACSHCDGRGYVASGSEQHERQAAR